MTFEMMIPITLRMREDCWPKGKRDLVGENMLGRLPVTQAGIQPCVKCSFAVKKFCSQFGYGQISQIIRSDNKKTKTSLSLS